MRGAEEVLQVGIGRIEHHADEGDGRERRPQPPHLGPERRGVERRGEHRAADVDAAGRGRVVVRDRGSARSGPRSPARTSRASPGRCRGRPRSCRPGRSCRSRPSGIPSPAPGFRAGSCCARRLPGIQSTPPEKAVVPPKTGAFSTTTTSSPCFLAVIAVERPPAPEPITSTSQSMSASSAMRIPPRLRPAPGPWRQ